MQDGKKFIVCLHEMTNDEENARGIGFSVCGTLVEIRDPDFLCQTVLPKYFRHSNLRSLIRQLNNYGFASRPTKMHVAQCFYHQLFIRGRQDLTDQIRRKTSTVPTKSPSNLFQPEVNVGNYLDGMEEDSAQYQAAVSRNLVLNQRHTELLARIRVLEEGLRTSSPLVSLSPLNTNFASFFSANGNNNNPTIAAVATPRIKTPTPSHMFTMRSSGEQQFFPSVVRSSGEQQPFRGGNVRASSGDGGIMDDDLFSFDLVRSLQWRQSMESTDDRL